MRTRVHVEGIAEAEKRIGSILSTLDSSDVEKVLVDGARIVRRDSRRRAPKGPTGNLRKAHRAKRGRKRDRLFRTAFAAVDRKKAPHAHIVHDGTAGPRTPRKHRVLYDAKHTQSFFGKQVAPMPSNPFFSDAVQATMGEVSRTVNSGIARLIGRAVK